MWWMLAGCIGVPLLLFFFFGSGNGEGFGGNWLLFGVLALCIGSHIAMMFGGHGGSAHKKLSKCPECGLHYEDETRAKECEAWCREHRSCNLEIISHAVESKRSI